MKKFPQCAVRAPRGGFTLIELAVVLTIIMIITGMLTSAVHTARRQARMAEAQSTVRQLVTAWRSYRIAYGAWPEGLSMNEPLPANEDVLDPLLGNNPRELVFLETADRTLRDPWGNPYSMRFSSEEIVNELSARVAVSFPNRHRYAD